jgi:hypothetical protein
LNDMVKRRLACRRNSASQLAAITPAAVTNWQFLDTNGPAFPKRFYRGWPRQMTNAENQHLTPAR